MKNDLSTQVGIEEGAIRNTVLLEKWKQSLYNHGYAGAVIMDLSKAFETINHELLIAKLHAYGLTKPVSKLLYSYLRNRWHRTKINTSFSTWKELPTGVPQGSILGPLLFSIYLNDLFFILDMTDVCNHADDTGLHACDKELPCLLTSLEHYTEIEWFEINFMNLNKDKCHLIAGHKYENLWVDVGGTKVWEVNTRIMLGIQIENNLYFDKHVIGLCKRAGRKLSDLKSLARILPFKKDEF